MNFFALATHVPLKWGTLPAVFIFVFYVFNFMDKVTSAEVKMDLSRFIKEGKYEEYLGVLPGVVQDMFDKAFGKTQASKKCLLRSISLSIYGAGILMLLSAIYNFQDLQQVFSGYGGFMEKAQAVLSKKEETKSIAEFIKTIGGTNLLLLLLPPLWMCWCLIPDYLAVLKTRIILIILRNTEASSSSLFGTMIIDFLIGVGTFAVSFVLFQMLLVNMIAAYNGHWPIGAFDNLAVFGLLFGLEYILLVMTGALFIYVPVANIFWASMLPSIWLWAYIFSALASRYLVASRSLLRGLVYFLDFTDHPIKSIGVVAAAVMTMSWAVILVALTFIWR